MVVMNGTRTYFKEPNVQIHLLISSIYASSPCSQVSQPGLKVYVAKLVYFTDLWEKEQNESVFLQISNCCHFIQQ